MEKASFTFTTPFNINLVEIKGEEHLFVEGDISTNDIDLVNDMMTKECQDSMQKQILESNMKLDVEHEAFRGDTHEETEINKTKIPAGKIIDATVKDLGDGRYSTRVKGEINRHNPNYTMIKGNLLDKYLDAFSVAFLPLSKKQIDRNGKIITQINDVKLLNIALTGNPCNTKAQLTEIFRKSIDALKDYKELKKLDPSIEKQLIVKTNDLVVNDKLNNKNNKMTDKETEEIQEESNESEEMKSVSENLKSLNEKYEEVSKENDGLKKSMEEISKSLLKITSALENPIHKSYGVQKEDAQKFSETEEIKSVDPLSLI